MSNYVQYGSVSGAEWNRLLAAGWRGHAGDHMEALYAPSGAVAKAAREWADQHTASVAGMTTGLYVATLATVSPLVVSWRNRQVLAAGKDANYTPTIGDRVRCSVVDDQLFIDYRIG